MQTRARTLSVARPSSDELLDIPVELVHPKVGQPRQHFDEQELRLLAASIDADGQVVRAIVRPHPTIAGEYELIAGERRWRAISGFCKRVNVLRAIVVHDATNDAEAYRRSFVENENRVDLYPLEKAQAIRSLMKFGTKVSEIARMTGRSQESVYITLSLLNLIPAVQAMMDPSIPARERLPVSAAIAISRLPSESQLEMARFAMKRGTRLTDLRDRIDATATGQANIARRRAGSSRLMTVVRSLDRLIGARYSRFDQVHSSFHQHAHLSATEMDESIGEVEELRTKLDQLLGLMADVRKRKRA